MSNEYYEKLVGIAEIIREASDGNGWGDYKIGIPISDISSKLHSDFELDLGLWTAISRLKFSEEVLSPEEEDTLTSAFIYSCKAISDLGIDPNEAIWRKYYINFCTYAIPFSITSNEINRQAIKKDTYSEGIFDRYNKDARNSLTTLELRKRAFKDAGKWFRETEFPAREKNVGIIQLIFKDWLLHLGKPFTPEDIKGLLMNEILELAETERSNYTSKKVKWERAYEAADVMICIMHMFTIYGIKMGEILDSE